MNRIKQFLAAHTADTHAIAAVVAFLVGAYFQVAQFHDLMVNLYGKLPQTGKEMITTAAALYMWYRKDQKPAT